MQVDLVVKIGNQAGMIRNDSDPFANFRSPDRASKIQHSVFFVEPVNNRVWIIRKQSIAFSLPRRQSIAGKRFGSSVNDGATVSRTTHHSGEDGNGAVFQRGCFGWGYHSVVVDFNSAPDFSAG